MASQWIEPIRRREPQAIGHHPAGHLAGGGPLQGFHDLEPIVVRQPDVESHVHVVLRRIDIADHRIDGGVGIRQQPRLIAAHRWIAADRLADPKERNVTLRQFRFQISRVRPGRLAGSRQLRQHLAHPIRPPPANARFAEEEIGDNTRHRQKAQRRHPRHAGRRFPMRPQDDSHHEGEMEQKKKACPHRFSLRGRRLESHQSSDQRMRGNGHREVGRKPQTVSGTNHLRRNDLEACSGS